MICLLPVADPRRGAKNACPLQCPNAFIFMHFQKKNYEITGWCTPQRLAPPLGNPGSTTYQLSFTCWHANFINYNVIFVNILVYCCFSRGCHDGCCCHVHRPRGVIYGTTGSGDRRFPRGRLVDLRTNTQPHGGSQTKDEPRVGSLKRRVTSFYTGNKRIACIYLAFDYIHELFFIDLRN